MFGLGVPEILVIAVILLFIFGAKRLPGIGEGLGKTIKEFRNVKKEIKGEGQVEKKKEIAEGGQEEASASEGEAAEGDLTDALQQKVAKQVKDKVLGQVPGIKQVRQFKATADKIKKIVS